MHRSIVLLLVLMIVALPASGCLRCGAYYQAMEKIGLEKRDLLVKRVESARDAQQEAQQQFRDALQEFQSLVGYKGGELEARYEKLRSEFESSQKRAAQVHEKIANVKDVSERLFGEWRAELGKYQDAELRRESERELNETRQKYDQLLAVMERAASRMNPVLSKLQDQVLFLKHHLNAKALGSLKGTAETLQADVTKLIDEMQTSIGEASKFIDEMKAAP